jgi:hypothetical protein
MVSGKQVNQRAARQASRYALDQPKRLLLVNAYPGPKLRFLRYAFVVRRLPYDAFDYCNVL